MNVRKISEFLHFSNFPVNFFKIKDMSLLSRSAVVRAKLGYFGGCEKEWKSRYEATWEIIPNSVLRGVLKTQRRSLESLPCGPFLRLTLLYFYALTKLELPYILEHITRTSVALRSIAMTNLLPSFISLPLFSLSFVQAKTHLYVNADETYDPWEI